VVQPREWIGVDTVARQVHAVAVAAVDWTVYRLCPVCRRASGDACVSLSGAVAGGRPDGILTEITHAHAARRRRSGR